MESNLPQPASGEIDPRLQETASNSRPYPPPNQFKLPPPPSHFQNPHQQQQQHQYASTAQPPAPPPQWTANGYGSYYGPPDHRIPPNQAQQHAGHAYQPYPVPGRIPPQASDQSSLGEPADAKRARACEACRSLKVKCEPDPTGGMCKRCAKSNRSCIITAPSRKRQKKADNRVAELERKIDALTQTLSTAKEGTVTGSESGIDVDEGAVQSNFTEVSRSKAQRPGFHSNTSGIGRKRPFSEYQQDSHSGPSLLNPSTSADQHHPPGKPTATNMTDINLMRGSKASGSQRLPEADRGSVTENDVADPENLPKHTADELFTHYNTVMAPHMPIVIFPRDFDSDDVRETDPVLFLAILSVASGQKHPILQRKLKKKIMRTLADRIIDGESKSLEILQAFQVIIIWYLPEPSQESKYYQLIHMAAGLAIDLGINRKPEANRNKFNVLQHESASIDTDSIESRRAWLGTYLLYSSVAMGMRRPNLIRNDGYLQECITTLRLSEDPSHTDTTLCNLVYLQTLADGLSEQILPDDYISLSEAKARNTYKAFEKRIKDWQDQNAGNMSSLALCLTFNVISLYMHELIMQHVSSLEPAKQPQRSWGRYRPDQSHGNAPAQGGSISVAMTSSVGILDTFSKFSIEEVRTLPTFYFAQIAHASVSLIKMYFVARADVELSKHVPVTAEIIEERLSRLVDLLRSACSESLVAITSLKMMVIIQTLFGEHKHSTLAIVKARYSGVPSLRGTQILDLGEPQPTPQQRTAPRASVEPTDDALHLLSAAAMKETNVGESRLRSGQSDVSSSGETISIDGETATMGQLIGDENMGFVSDEGYMGIMGVMQQMWARSK